MLDRPREIVAKATRRILAPFTPRPFTRFEPAGDGRQPWGKGTGRASYAVVQSRRAANRRARAARRITRRTR